MANQIMVIKPYRWEGMWVFDEERVGLHKEPFVAGADTIIDVAVGRKGIVNPEKGFLMFFSGGPFPGADIKLQWVREEMGGNVYQWEELEGWLCPALLKFFPEAPRKIYGQIKPLHKEDSLEDQPGPM
jgi:hypothetical protein